MHAKTTIARSKSFEADRIWLNGKEESIENPRLVNCLREIRKRSGSEDPVHICSENNFPTAAGLASSAAGYACLGNYRAGTKKWFDILKKTCFCLYTRHSNGAYLNKTCLFSISLFFYQRTTL